MEFEYFYVTTVGASVNIDNIGNFALEANDDMGQSYYLVIRTTLGSSRIFQYGPIVTDISLLPKTCSCTFKRIEYSDSKIKKIIDNFLNNPYAKITQAKEIDIVDALDKCVSIIDEMKKEEL